MPMCTLQSIKRGVAEGARDICRKIQSRKKSRRWARSLRTSWRGLRPTSLTMKTSVSDVGKDPRAPWALIRDGRTSIVITYPMSVIFMNT
eukprot:773072-Pyramimonas_sp.AAC.1